ncbi:hypothetical protein N9W29_00605 [Candidatus Pelagibacter bacterium]|nr:hypothetical protein [Candidatus Pelagibacter bacterium]
MGSIFKFLQSLTRLASKGDIKIDDAYKFAKQEFGEVSDLLKLQINKIFKQSKAPSIKNPEKKPGEVIEASFKPGMDKRGKVVEKSPSQASGIMKTDEASPLMKNIDEVKQNIKGMSENNPKTFRMTEEQRNALGYPNRMIEGIVRTAAREILSKKGIDVSKADPIDTFADIFGVNSLERLEDVSDELLSAQDYKQLNSILQKNELYDVTPKSGLNLKQSDEIEELTEFDPTGRKPSAMGGRINYAIGSLPKGIQALVKTINKKFGKDAVKTADEIDRPKNVQAFDDFEARNPDPKRELTDNEFQDLVEDVGELDAYDFDGTVGSANRIRKEAKDYQDYMYKQYKMGKLNPEAGDKSPARKRFLEQKLEEMESSGDSKLMTREEIEELTFFDSGTEMDEAAKKAIDNSSINDEIKRGIDDVMSDTSPEGLAKSIEIDNLMLEYPGISKDFADQIASSSPTMKADMIAMVEQAFKMDQIGMSGDEIIDAFKKGTDRTKQANGGLSYLMGM